MSYNDGPEKPRWFSELSLWSSELSYDSTSYHCNPVGLPLWPVLLVTTMVMISIQASKQVSKCINLLTSKGQVEHASKTE